MLYLILHMTESSLVDHRSHETTKTKGRQSKEEKKSVHTAQLMYSYILIFQSNRAITLKFYQQITTHA